MGTKVGLARLRRAERHALSIESGRSWTDRNLIYLFAVLSGGPAVIAVV